MYRDKYFEIPLIIKVYDVINETARVEANIYLNISTRVGVTCRGAEYE